MPEERVRTRTSLTWREPDGILKRSYFAGARVSLLDAQENTAALATLNLERPYPLFVDLRELHSMDRAARAYYASEASSPFVSSVALLVKSPLSRVIGAFFLGMRSHPFPVRMFTDADEALTWLRAVKR